MTWLEIFRAQGPGGEMCVRRDCVEHPRVYSLSQRASADVEWVTLYYVEGIPAQHWHSAEDAVSAAEANP